MYWPTTWRLGTPGGVVPSLLIVGLSLECGH
jgi:hypothetical protein